MLEIKFESSKYSFIIVPKRKEEVIESVECLKYSRSKIEFEPNFSKQNELQLKLEETVRVSFKRKLND